MIYCFLYFLQTDKVYLLIGCHIFCPLLFAPFYWLVLKSLLKSVLCNIFLNHKQVAFLIAHSSYQLARLCSLTRPTVALKSTSMKTVLVGDGTYDIIEATVKKTHYHHLGRFALVHTCMLWQCAHCPASASWSLSVVYAPPLVFLQHWQQGSLNCKFYMPRFVNKCSCFRSPRTAQNPRYEFHSAPWCWSGICVFRAQECQICIVANCTPWQNMNAAFAPVDSKVTITPKLPACRSVTEHSQQYPHAFCSWYTITMSILLQWKKLVSVHSNSVFLHWPLPTGTETEMRRCSKLVGCENTVVLPRSWCITVNAWRSDTTVNIILIHNLLPF